jgi:hypothetical protein
MKGQAPVNGKFGVHAVFVRPDNRRRDLDNLFKSLLDILTHLKVIEDDHLMDNIAAEWAENDGSYDVACIVWINTVPEAIKIGDNNAKKRRRKTGEAVPAKPNP